MESAPSESEQVAEPHVEGLLSSRRVSGFPALLSAYAKSGRPLRSAIDGGAGAGHTAREMLEHVTGEIFAFEPFPGNHRFFSGLDPRVRLIRQALADAPGNASFRVASVVTEDSPWGKRGMAGYSSVGKLVSEQRDGDHLVECVRADDVVPEEAQIDFVKLDLQGGELNALKGMERILRDVLFLWVEFTGTEGLVGWLCDRGFEVFDTDYLLMGEPTDETRELFEFDSDIQLSTGRTAWTGFRRTDWEPYEDEFHRLRKEAGLVQTDLVCVNGDHAAEFERALEFL